MGWGCLFEPCPCVCCEWLHWRSPNEKLKDMSCRTALLKLNRQGLIPLPEPVGRNLLGLRRRCEEGDVLGRIDKIACTLEQLGQVELIPIDAGDRETLRIWNGLMERYHYLGSGPL